MVCFVTRYAKTEVANDDFESPTRQVDGNVEAEKSKPVAIF